MRAIDVGAWRRTYHFERDGGGDRQRRGLLKGTRLRCLARSGAQADVHRRSHDPWQDIEAWQSLSAGPVRAGGLGRAGEAVKSWIEAAKKRLHHNVLAIALANKLARIAWAVLNKERNFECTKTNAMERRPA
jgi:hypothetical protein